MGPIPVATNHTLHRTFGRTLWLAGVKIETVRDLLGHEDTKTTLYLGVNKGNKSEAMTQLAEFQSALKRAKIDEPGSSKSDKQCHQVPRD